MAAALREDSSTRLIWGTWSIRYSSPMETSCLRNTYNFRRLRRFVCSLTVEIHRRRYRDRMGNDHHAPASRPWSPLDVDEGVLHQLVHLRDLSRLACYGHHLTPECFVMIYDNLENEQKCLRLEEPRDKKSVTSIELQFRASSLTFHLISVDGHAQPRISDYKLDIV